MSQDKSVDPTQPTAIKEINELIKVNHDEAFNLLNTYLENFPDDIEAYLLKAELCLKWHLTSHYDVVASVLYEKNLPSEFSKRKRQLKEKAEKEVYSLLEKGRAKLKENDGRNAIVNFEGAILLLPEDAAILYGCGLALAGWDAPNSHNRFRQSISSRETRNQYLQKYLKQALEITLPGDSIYDDSAYHLAQNALETDALTASILEYLHTIPQPEDEAYALMQKIREAVAKKALTITKILLQIGETRKASGLLKLIKKIAPMISGIELLVAEKFRVNQQNEKALAKYKQATGTRRRSKAASFELVLKLQKRLDKLSVGCPICKKRHAPDLNCQICNRDHRRYELLENRYNTDDLVLLAHIGAVELHQEAGQNEQSLEHLNIVMEALPKGHQALIELRVIQVQLQRTENQLSPLVTILDELDSNGITRGLLYRIDRVSNTAPEQWFELPVTTRLRLCRRLCEGNYLHEARRLFATAFVDNPERKSVKSFSAYLKQCLQIRAKDLYEQARHIFNNHHPDDTIQLVSQALALTPENPQMLLLRGRARTLAGHDAPALDDLYHVLNLTEDVQIRRTASENIADLLERRWDIAGANAILDSIEDQNERIATKREQLQRRQSAKPFMLIRPLEEIVTEDRLTLETVDDYISATFALVLREVSPASGHRDFQKRLLDAGFEFIQILGTFRDMALDVCFGLRVICHPYPIIPERGSITLALIARVNGIDSSVCQQQAHQIYQDIMACLPLAQESIHIFEPVVDENELRSLLEPFEIAHISEIVRQESDPKQDGVYTVTPFTPGTVDMHNLFWTLLRQSNPSMVSIHLKPTHIYNWDQHITGSPITKRMHELNDQAMDDSNQDMDLYDLRLQAAEINKAHLEQRQTYHSRMETLRTAHILRVNVVGSAGTSYLLPHMTAATLMGPAGNAQNKGGYDIMQVTHGSDWKIAQYNLSQIDVAHLGYSTVPLGQIKVRYAVSEHEAANIFRFPIPNHDGVPGIQTLEGRSVPPPTGMAQTGTMLGVSTARAANSMPVPVIISDADRRRHMYVVGKTGTGKSTLLAAMLVQDIMAGKTVCLLDPHGDLVQEVLLRIPDYRMDDVIYIDPSDENFPIGLNILHSDGEVDKSKIVNNFIAMLQRLYDPHNQAVVGPIFQSTVRNAMLAVMDIPRTSLADVYRVLMEPEYLKKIINDVKDPIVKATLEKELKRQGDYSKSWRAELVPYLTSKFSRFVEDPVLRRIVSQSSNSINWFEAIQSRKIILLNLAKGHVGTETSQFLGLLILGQVLEAVYKRAKLPAAERHDFSIVIDEVQNYSTPLLSTIISEGRKFGVSLTIANQFLHQLDNGLREAVFGNIGTLAAMRVGVDDAAMLAREFYPVFSADDLTKLPRFTTALKLLVNGMATRPFTMRTRLPTEPPHPERAQQIQKMSQERYGTPIALVEQEMAQRFTD